MSIASSSVTLFRSLWSTRFVDAVNIDTPTTGGTFNTSTLQYDGGSSGSLYSGAALLRPAESVPREERTQEEITFLVYDLFLPWDAGVFAPDSIVSVTASETDAELVGKTFRVVSTVYDGYLTRRHLRIELDLGRGSGRA